MRNKWLLTFILAILALPIFSISASADGPVLYEDGEYEIPFVVKHATDDKTSGADGYLTKPAKLIVKDDELYVQLKLTSSSMIKSLKVPSGEVDLISEDLEGNTRVVGFKVEGDLKESIEMKIHVVVPAYMFPPNGYDTTHTARAFFDVSGVPTKVAVEEPVDEPTQPEEDPNEPVEEEEEKQVGLTDLKDGYYTVNASYLRDDNDNPSSMARYLDSALFLSIKEGKAELTITVNEDNTVTLLQFNGKNAVEKIVDGGKRYETFKLGQIQSLFDSNVEYQAPMRDGSIHYGKANFRIALNEESIKETDASNKPGLGIPGNGEEPTDPVEPEEPTKPEPPVGDDGDKVENTDPALIPDEAFTINYISTSNSVSRQFNNPSTLLYKNGEMYIQITGTGGQYIESLTINGKEVTWGKKNDDGTFTIQFKVEGSLSDKLDFGMVINTGRNIMEHLVDLSFDESTQTATDIADYTLIAEKNEPEVPSEGDDPADKEGNQKPIVKEEQLTPNKAYEIDFVIKHETDDKPSAADSFFKGPAILLEKDGERYIQITVTGKQYINSLKTKFGDMVFVKENDDGSIVVQFKVDGDLSDVIDLYMKITVPGVYNGQEHIARLFLDESSLKEVNANDYRLVASNNENGPTVEGKPADNNPLPGAKNNTPKTNNTNIDPTIEKPKLDSNKKNETTNKTKVTGQEKNPQTGDTTNIMLYVLLLIGSAIPLAIQLKKRFAKVA